MKSETTAAIESAIEGLPPMMREQCLEFADHLRRQVANAGPIVGVMAMALVGSELEMSISFRGHQEQRSE